MGKNTHREPTLYIVGNKERALELKHIIEDEWGGDNKKELAYSHVSSVYYIDSCGTVDSMPKGAGMLVEAVANGWMKEYELPEKPQFKPFDKEEPAYRPYSSAEELDKAIKDHGMFVRHKELERRIAVLAYSGTDIETLSDYEDNRSLLTYYTWLDGTPCGVQEGGEDE